MKHFSKKNELLIIVATIALLIGFISSSYAQGVIVTDINNKNYEVEGLYILYRLIGVSGVTPETTMSALSFSIKNTENRVSSTEFFKINLSDIKKIVFKHQAGNYWTTFWVDLELKNGEKVSFDHDKHTYIKKDENGKIIQSLKGVDISGGAFRDRNLVIMDFKGRAKRADGKEGDFSIKYFEVKSIEFQ